eukprot:TRINITY_DN55470_c0_g1_i1.p1 TRINITY_DN55470_c0_g1~~TRINITY_DN55470_c0_g1_i1.p1  ORF type:complete len:403 (-),score=84.13 TRINITY_DN55470_c0_g1_i1:15-1223(-)
MRAADLNGMQRRRAGVGSDAPAAAKPLDAGVVAPPLRPPAGSFAALELAANRLGRLGLAALVPLAGACAALPRALLLQHNAPLCLRPRLWHPDGAVQRCDESPLRQEAILQLYWHHFVFAAWVGVQFTYNFAEACFRDPGCAAMSASGTGHCDLLARSRRGGEVEVIGKLAPRWCEVCQGWKPTRAHHSSKMGCCVLRMDHYCVTVENVVGVRNHGHFVLMVIFGSAGLLYALVMLIFTLSCSWRPAWELYGKLSRHSSRYGQASVWSIPSNALHAMIGVLGMEMLFFMIASALSVYLIRPLVLNVLIAAEGMTVLETLSIVSNRDFILLPDDKVIVLPLGAFSRSSRLSNIRALLGSRWIWRLIFPVRGDVDKLEEATPVLNDKVAEDVRKRSAEFSKTAK